MTAAVAAPPRILVAEDDPTSALILTRALQGAGYEVLHAVDGFQAADIATKYVPDLILLDMMIPGRDGIETCTLLKSQERTSEIPVIFVTAVTTAELVVRAFGVGGVDYVTKPFRTEEVLARVAAHIRIKLAEGKLSDNRKETLGLAREMAEANVDSALLGRIDPLTRVFNRQAWQDAAEYEQKRFESEALPYSILMIDVDHFKAYNDSQGHVAGDECLCRIVEAVVSSCRPTDIVARFVGDEFVVLASEMSSEATLMLAERIRETVWALAIPHPCSAADERVTVSIGVGDGGASREQSLRAADKALHVAKRAGRNMVYGAGQLTLECNPASDPAGSPSVEQLDRGDETRPPRGPGGNAHRDASHLHATALVVDDESTNRALCRHCLEKNDIRVEEAMDGQSALRAVAEHKPDVIVMNVMMPNMDGLECTRQLKADPAAGNIPIIMVSSRSNESDILAGLEAGADDYLCKPIRPRELAMRVRSLIRTHRERKNLLRSYRSRGEQARALGLLLDFSRQLGRTEDLGAVLRETVAVTARLSSSHRISILRPDDKRRYLRIAESTGIDGNVVERILVPIHGTVIGQVFASRRSRVINTDKDVAERHRHGEADMAGPTKCEADVLPGLPLICMPLCALDETIGVLTISERTGRHPFTPAELEYINLICNTAAPAIRDISSRRKRDEAYESIVVALAKLAEHRDNDTGRHVERVTKYSVMLAEEIRTTDRFASQVDEQFLHALERAVPLHDIGKVAIPDDILRKPGKLTPDQWTIMMTHAGIGAETIRSVLHRAPGVGFLAMAEEIARAHHEWYDGNGYPAGLSGDAIPLSARIVAVADVYDALTMERPYKKAYSHDKATAIIVEGSGTQFEPDIVEAFLRREEDFKSLATQLADKHPAAQTPFVAVTT
jgi:diguanylate cyclase (GGDEF)-like protein